MFGTESSLLSNNYYPPLIPRFLVYLCALDIGNRSTILWTIAFERNHQIIKKGIT